MSVVVLYSRLPDEINSQLVDKLDFSLNTEWKTGLMKGIDLQQYTLSLLGRKLLKSYFKSIEVEVSFFLGELGKPIVSGNYFVSIAHSGNISIVAISTSCEVGIDIEKVCSINPGEYADYFSENEMDVIRKDETQTKFFEFWTSKEAVAKAVGMGLELDFSKLVGDIENTFVCDDNEWHVLPVKTDDGFVAHVALKKGNAKQEIELTRVDFGSLLEIDTSC